MTRAIEELGLEGSRLLLAVSGGPDSVAMLHLLSDAATELRLTLAVGTVDHGLREASKEEVRGVARLALGRGLPFGSRTLVLDGNSPGLEAAARAARYAALEEMRDELGMEFIATAHSADDQAETVLLRLTRGTSLRGAAGIRARRGLVVRPLLGFRRRELVEVCEAARLPVAADPMNQDRKFARVRVRKDVLPVLDSLAEGAAARLAAFASDAERDEGLLAEEAEAAWGRLSVSPGYLDAAGVRALPAPLRSRVLRRLIERACGTCDHRALQTADVALRAHQSAELFRPWSLDASGSLVRVRSPSSERPWGNADRLGWRWSPDRASGLAVPWPASTPTENFVNPDLPRGNGHRVLSDLLVDLGIPEEDRAYVPALGFAGKCRVVPGIWTDPGLRGGTHGWLHPLPEGLRASEWLLRYRVVIASRR